MNRTDLVRTLSNQGVENAELAVAKLIEVLTVSLAAGEDVSIRNFGKLECKQRASIVRKNPKTGIPIEVPERTTVTFTPSPALRERVNGK